MTERARYIFEVKEYDGGQPWIIMNPLSGEVPPLTKGFIGFDLAQGTTYEKAREIADLLNREIIHVAYTECD
jgi:hypothetical protein